MDATSRLAMAVFRGGWPRPVYFDVPVVFVRVFVDSVVLSILSILPAPPIDTAGEAQC